MRLVEYLARINRSSISCWRATGGSLRRSVAVHSGYYLSRTRRHLPGIASGSSLRVIAQASESRGLHGQPRTVRHGGRAQYRANQADQQAWNRLCGPSRAALHPRKLQQIVASKLVQDWSPEQISGWLKQSYPDDENLRVSHETIYRSLFIQARGALKQEPVRHLRSQAADPPLAALQRSRAFARPIVDAISIRERPAEVEDRAVPGHWEGDLLRGGGNTHVVTLVERQ